MTRDARADARNREDVPCESDEHVFRPEVYAAAAGEAWIEDECCTICGWSWADIAEHEVGICCCPGDHRAKSPEGESVNFDMKKLPGAPGFRGDQGDRR